MLWVLIGGCLAFVVFILLLAFGLGRMGDDADDFDGGFGADYPPEWRSQPSPQAVAECGCDGARLDATGHCIGCAYDRKRP